MEIVMRQNKEATSNGEAGFTLLETSIALVLLTIVGLGIAGCFFYAVKNNSSARDRELAMGVAQQQIEQFRNLKFSDAGLSATAGTTSATIFRGGRRYVVQTSITDGNVQNGSARTKTIQIRVVPWSDSSPWARNANLPVFGAVTIIAERTAPTMGPNRLF